MNRKKEKEEKAKKRAELKRDCGKRKEGMIEGIGKRKPAVLNVSSMKITHSFARDACCMLHYALSRSPFISTFPPRKHQASERRRRRMKGPLALTSSDRCADRVPRLVLAEVWHKSGDGGSVPTRKTKETTKETDKRAKRDRSSEGGNVTNIARGTRGQAVWESLFF